MYKKVIQCFLRLINLGQGTNTSPGKNKDKHQRVPVVVEQSRGNRESISGSYLIEEEGITNGSNEEGEWPLV